MVEPDTSELIKILSQFGFNLEVNKQPAIELSILEESVDDAKNNVSYLFDEDIVDLEVEREDEIQIILEDEYHEMAERLDYAQHLRFDGDVDRMAKKSYGLPEEITNPEISQPEKLEPIEANSHHWSSKYDLALYPFGKINLDGSSRRELSSSRVEQISSGDDFSHELSILEATGWLETVNRDGKIYYRLAEDENEEVYEDVHEYVKDLAKCIQDDYRLNLKRFRENPDKWNTT